MMIRWRDNSIRLIAIFMAVLLWVYVANEQNPVTSHTYQIPLSVLGKPEVYVVSELPDKVDIKFKTSSNLGATLRVRDFTAQIDLSGIREGEQQLTVQVTAPPGVEVFQVTPQVIQVAAVKIAQKSVQVTLNPIGEVARGFVRGEPVMQPQAVTLQGPSKVLAGINRLDVALNLAGAENDLVREVPVQTGHKDVTISPNRILVTVPVNSLPTQELPVRVELTGAPAEGYLAGELVVQPATVLVTGPRQVIDVLTEVNAPDVDISGVTEDVARDVELILPNGATLLQPQQVQVSLDIVPQETEPQPGAEEESNGEESAEDLTEQ